MLFNATEILGKEGYFFMLDFRTDIADQFYYLEIIRISINGDMKSR